MSEKKSIPYGKPLANQSFYILDDKSNILPAGIVGELCIGGAGVAREYFGEPDLTRERFVEHAGIGQRLYRTGDLGRYLHDGNIEFIGRVDDQVKIRGFRIELGEIEQQLTQVVGISSGLVLAQGERDSKQLVAYFIANEESKQAAAEAFISSIKAALLKVLPEYMVPSAFVQVKQWPLTANGKVDKKGLPAPDRLSRQQEYCAPKTEVEQQLVAIWSELLSIPEASLSTTANFFELGGHSLLSIRLVAQVRTQLAVELTIRDMFAHPSIQQLAALVDKGIDNQIRPAVVPYQRPDVVLLSFAQQRLWFIDQMQGGSANYNMPVILEVSGAFNLAFAEQALQQIVSRHEVLRTVYCSQEDGAVQVIRSEVQVSLPVTDLSAFAKVGQQAQVEAFAEADAIKPFDLSQDVMLRAHWLLCSKTAGSEEGFLLFNMHHIASDGWSMGVLVDEFVRFYQAQVNGVASALVPLEIQYADYALWQRDYLQGQVLEQQLDYWIRQLEDAPVVHGLPLDFARPAEMAYQGGLCTYQITGEVIRQLTQLAQAQGLTPFMVLHATFSLLLSRYSNSNDIVIGTPVANRMQQELEPLIGFFVNTLVLRTNIGAGESVSDYLNHIKQVNLDAQSHQDIPFEQLVEQLKLPRSTQHAPLFQVMLSMDNNEQASLELDEVIFTPITPKHVAAKFDLMLDVLIDDSGLHLSWTYDKALFKAETVAQFNQHFEQLLAAMVTRPEARLTELDMLSSKERQYLVHDLNSTGVDYPEDKLIHDLFSEQVLKTPDNIALVFEEQTLTYLALERRANQLAHYLREQGVGVETLVGIAVDRSVEMVVGILAVLKAGGAYVPLDPGYPQARLEHMLKDSQIKVLLTQSHLVERFKGGNLVSLPLNTIALDTMAEQLLAYSDQNPDKFGQMPSSLAYVIYTSGSTGLPKGVMIEHRNLVNATLARGNIYQQLTGYLLLSSFAFDSSVAGIFFTLISGAKLCLPSDKAFKDMDVLIELINSEKISHLLTVPSLYQLMLESKESTHFSSLKEVTVAGEPCTAKLVAAHLENKTLRDVFLFNEYGPTEATIFATVGRIVSEDTISIGKAINNTQLYILDSNQNTLPFGCVGELYIGGKGVARGYLNQASLTGEKFIPHPFSNNPHERLYKTGDLVRYLHDGNLEFIGRVDDQVKIRGFRIELGEIEQQLSQLDDVQSSLVLGRGEDGNKQLVAYLISYETEASKIPGEFICSVKADLAKVLPDYMVPSAFVLLEQWPLTANGKIDKKALPLPDVLATQKEYQAPTTDTEHRLVGIWSELLEAPAAKLSIIANFFELGGHSLMSIRLVGQIRSRLNVEISIKEIFELPTILQLAALIDGGVATVSRPPVTLMDRHDSMPLSFAQQRIWFIDQMQGGSANYNMPIVLKVEGLFNVELAEQALQQIIARHEVLHTIYQSQDDGAIQVINEQVDFTLSTRNLTDLDVQAQQAEVQQIAMMDALKPFNLSADVMLRASWLLLDNTLGEEQGVLLFNMHHIASDGWSMGILVDEFVQLYQAFTTGTESPLVPLAIQYIDYALWQRDYLQGEVLQKQLDYWIVQLDDVPVVHSLPLDYNRPAQITYEGDVISSRLSRDIGNKVIQFAQQQNMTPFMVVHATFSLLLSRYSDSSDIVIGTPTANRLQQEIEPLIGFFINTLVLRTNNKEYETVEEYLVHIKQTNLDAQAHQDVPFEQLVEQLNVPRSVQHTPLFQILLSMNTNKQSSLALDGLTFTSLPPEQVLAKFDLSLDVFVDDDGIDISWTYDKALFKVGTIQRLNQHFETLLTGIVNKPQAKLADLPMLSEEEINYQVHELNDTQVDYPKDKLIHELFEEQVGKTGYLRAVQFGDDFLTYDQLSRQSSKLAKHIGSLYQVSKGIRVGIYAERSCELLVAMLACMKLGAVFVPLDPRYSRTRLKYAIQDSQISLMLTQSKFVDEMQLNSVPWEVISQLCEENDDLQLHSQCGEVDIELNQETDLVYILYTSGSTGTPKGVEVTHAGLLETL